LVANCASLSGISNGFPKMAERTVRKVKIGVDRWVFIGYFIKIRLMMNKLGKAFSLIKSGRFDLVLGRLNEVFWGRNILPVLPHTLMVEPTNLCNLNCPTCPTGAGKMNRPKRVMSFNEFKRIIDEVRGYVKNIALWNYGEPFLNSELLLMIRYATKAGISVKTSTNGEFFKSKGFCREVVRSGLRDLTICLDGANQETISKFRRGSNFSEIVQGIRFISEAKRELGSKTPRIELQFIVLRYNEHQRGYMKMLAKELGADVYCEKTVGLDYNDPQFQKMAREFLPNDLSLSRYYLKPDGQFALKGKMRNRCSWVYQCAVINSDGTVVPCCYDLYSEYVMGNVFEESLRAIWRNDKYQELRRKIRMGRKSIPMCNICPEGRYSIFKRRVL